VTNISVCQCPMHRCSLIDQSMSCLYLLNAKVNMQMTACLQRIFGYLFSGFLAVGVFACHEDPVTNPDVRNELLVQINTLRKTGCTCGTEWLPPVEELTWDEALADAALNHATDMYVKNYFNHISLDGSSPIQRAQNAGYSGDYVGEVIARKFSLTTDVVEAWKESESHCRALMDSLYKQMGGARKGDYWVVDLGRPK
jgi:uncharacterized protein YkwD